MQAKLVRGKTAFRRRSVALSVAILAGVPLMLVLCSPERALAQCGASRPAHAASIGGGGVHIATSRPAVSGGGSGGGGRTLGCANGASRAALRGLPVASSGRVVETGARGGHAAMRPRNAPSKNASAHLHVVRPAHRA
jgi:hypothetical protein